MIQRGLLAGILACLLAGAASAADTGFVPDTTVLARVNDRVIRARDFAASYRDALVEYKPAADSLGYVEFLNSMVSKEILGLTALAGATDASLSYEDRLQLREYSARVYSNILYQRAVMDSVSVSEDEIRTAWECYKYKIHLRRILFADRPTAERVRRELVAGRTGWSLAVKRYSIAADRTHDGDLGWQDCQALGFDYSAAVRDLKPGQYAQILESRDGYDLAQCVERKVVDPPAYDGLRSLILDQLTNAKASRRADAIQQLLADRIGLEVDSVNVAWAATKFNAARSISPDAGGATLSFDTVTPEFEPADTSRVLARWRGGQLTVSGYLTTYMQMQPLMRPNVNDYWLLRSQVLATATDPYTTELAIARGYDKSPVAIELIRKRREELLVEHLYRDSVESKVWIRPEERRAFYEEHKHQYVTYAKVTYGAIWRASRAGADSVAARLRAGEEFRSILAADSLMGEQTGSIQERSESEHGTQFYRLLMEELKPGQLSIEGPDKKGGWLVLQVLKRDDGRQLSFEEAQHFVDDSLQNLKTEERLKEFLARAKRNFKVEMHPELVMRVANMQ